MSDCSFSLVFFYILALLRALRAKRSVEWVLRTITLFADDIWGSWTLRSSDDFRAALADLTAILETLVEFRMQINYGKTAILLRLEGRPRLCCMLTAVLRTVSDTLAGNCSWKNRAHPHKGETHEYVGTQVSYHHRLDKNVKHRIQAGQAKHQQLRKTLNGTHAMSAPHRVRLWVACVQTSLLYSLPAVGVTRDGLARLTKVMTRHLRAIFRQPAHITHCSNEAILQRAALEQPGDAMLRAVTKFTDKLRLKERDSPDITTAPGIFESLRSLQASLQAAIEAHNRHESHNPPTASDQYPCPECAAAFSSDNARRIHCKLKHGYLPDHETRRPVKFQAHLHAQVSLNVSYANDASSGGSIFALTSRMAHVSSSVAKA